MSDRTKILLLLTPALSIIILLFFGGLFIGLLRSFNYMPIIGLTEPNLNAYFSVFKSKEFFCSVFSFGLIDIIRENYSIASFKIFDADCEIGLPGPNIATTPLLNKKS